MSNLQLGYWKHYRGGVYKLIGVTVPSDYLPTVKWSEQVCIATHTETGQKMRVFRAADGGWLFAVGHGALCIYCDADGKFWARPQTMWLEKVTHTDGAVVQRFTFEATS